MFLTLSSGSCKKPYKPAVLVDHADGAATVRAHKRVRLGNRRSRFDELLGRNGPHRIADKGSIPFSAVDLLEVFKNEHAEQISVFRHGKDRLPVHRQNIIDELLDAHFRIDG